MRKSDLRRGMVVENAMGCKMLVLNGYNACGFMSDGNTEVWPALNNNWGHVSANDYAEDLTLKSSQTTCDPCHIVKIYEDYTCTKVLWERKERPELNQFEKMLLQELVTKYKYIARDSDGDIYVFAERPFKGAFYWNSDELAHNVCIFNYLFTFIKWEDEEPYSIKYLLGDSETNE